MGEGLYQHGDGGFTLDHFTYIAMIDMLRACQHHLEHQSVEAALKRLELLEATLTGAKR